MERVISRMCQHEGGMARQVSLEPEPETEGVNFMLDWMFSVQPWPFLIQAETSPGNFTFSSAPLYLPSKVKLLLFLSPQHFFVC